MKLTTNTKRALAVAGVVVGGVYLWMEARRLGKTPISPTEDEIKEDGGHALRLKDGRIMEYFDRGDPNGHHVMLAFHGVLTTGQVFGEVFVPTEFLKSRSIRLIAPSLPGHGLSSNVHDRKFKQYPRDVEELLVHLELQESNLMIIGASFGGPHAAVVAAHFKNRINTLALLCCVAPLYLNNGSPNKELKETIRMVARPFMHRHRRGGVFELIGKTICTLSPIFVPYTSEYRGKPKHIVQAVVNDVKRSFKLTHRGCMEAMNMVSSPWGFSLRDDLHHVGRVLITSGKKDKTCPQRQQEWIAKELIKDFEDRRVIHKIFEGEGHNHPMFKMEEIMDMIIEFEV